MMRILLTLILSVVMLGCSSTQTHKFNSEKDNKKEKTKRPTIKIKNPFTDDVNIEDILGR